MALVANKGTRPALIVHDDATSDTSSVIMIVPFTSNMKTQRWKHIIHDLKKWLIYLSCLVLGPISGFLLSGLWAEGANTFWKKIDYFPLRVERIASMQHSGDEFWVQADDHAVYHILYPCEGNQICWQKTDNIPAVEEEYPGSYKISYNQCENTSFVYPLFREIKMCATLTVLAPDAYYRISLALTSDGKLWIWEKPMVDPFTIVIQMIISTVVGAIAGFLVGLFLVWKIR
jgi:hypothetical protein